MLTNIINVVIIVLMLFLVKRRLTPTMIFLEATLMENPIELDEWLEEPTHDDAVEMMNAQAVVPFGTALWP
ncbi:hypothetical protein EP164_21940 [Photorhabdus luminescens subsp. sonorensis]|uniref:Uncharacterized protein n=1 Tax=Photorhabdus luminescens subsp. sonorensis TaxID=1173677 RepID=A0A5C4RC38_PHOLU|nr:hypothetical protein EP164_21940 [Photorhabdus luminescens subsp. sonorensis]